MPGELLVYLNGELVEESKARVSPFDRGFMMGDGVYEITGCFNGNLYRLDDHLDRLYRSLRYVSIDPGMTMEEMKKVTLDLFEANKEQLKGYALYRAGHWVTRGKDALSNAARDAGPPTVFIFFRLIEVEKYAHAFKEGVKVAVVPTRRNPPACIEPRAKVTSKLNQILAELDADASNSLSLILDIYGNVTENSVANFFLVRDGVLWTPPEKNILEGITRLAVFDMAERLGIPLEERDFTMYDVAQADEFFLSSSVICALPIREVDRFRPKAPVPGPITQRLVAAFVEETGFDFQKYVP
ncbi:MAG: aminotransferase class IV [Deltaproteobacteria bacterium]|nr:aminotransferase class IV [Deltaproteobacteria bacterium]